MELRTAKRNKWLRSEYAYKLVTNTVQRIRARKKETPKDEGKKVWPVDSSNP